MRSPSPHVLIALVLAVPGLAGCERLVSMARSHFVADAHGTAIAAGPTNWKRHAANPVIAPGEATPVGALAQETTDPAVVFDERTRKWKMWYTVGFRQHGQPRQAIRYAESVDGYDWRAVPGFALAPTGKAKDWDGQRVARATVLENPQGTADQRYMMYYVGAASQNGATAIGCAVSPDGRNFTRLAWNESLHQKPGLVMTAREAFPGKAGVTGSLTDPEVEAWDESIHLWFSAKAAAGGKPLRGLGHAKSKDGVAWTASAANPLKSLARPGSPGAAHPSVVPHPDTGALELWYTDDRADEGVTKPGMTLGYWHATSTDGEKWVTEYGQGRDFRWDRKKACEAAGPVDGASVVRRGGEVRLYYPARGTRKVPEGWPTAVGLGINVATRRD